MGTVDGGTARAVVGGRGRVRTTHPDVWAVMSRSREEGQALMARTIAGMTAKDQRDQLTVSAYGLGERRRLLAPA